MRSARRDFYQERTTRRRLATAVCGRFGPQGSAVAQGASGLELGKTYGLARGLCFVFRAQLERERGDSSAGGRDAKDKRQRGHKITNEQAARINWSSQNRQGGRGTRGPARCRGGGDFPNGRGV